MSFFGDVFGFEKNLLGQRVGEWKKAPERLILGINTPLDTAVWGSVTGKKYEPVVDMWGSPTEKQYASAQQSGVNTGPGRGMHDVAKTIAQMYTAKWLGGGQGGGQGGGMLGNMPLSGMEGGKPQQQNLPPVMSNQYVIDPQMQQAQNQPMNPNYLMANALRNYY